MTNEQRQHLLFILSGKIRRLIGKKVIDSGLGNCVVGYKEYFDLEDENGIILRRNWNKLFFKIFQKF